ncbi:MAG: CvpA family protein [Flavobacteriales bacterium]|nr:CvpA family protein [Flavobacteriales bacterium]
MNWLDWTLLALLAAAAIRGFFRGFIVEIASLVAVVLGIWVASRYNAHVASWVGMDAQHEVISFIVTFIGVLILVHLLAKVLTKAMDLACWACRTRWRVRSSARCGRPSCSAWC